MLKILKLKDGKAVTKRQKEIKAYRDLEYDKFRQAYEAADDNAKRDIDNYIASVNSYIASNPKANATDLSTDAYTRAYTKLNGGQPYTPQIYNPYDYRSAGNWIAQRYWGLNAESSDVNTTSALPSGNIYNWSANTGLDASYYSNATAAQKQSAFISKLKENLTNLQNKLNTEGLNVYGTNLTKEDVAGHLATLSGMPTENLTEAQFNSLRDIAQKAGITGDEWNFYMGGNGSSDNSANADAKKAWTDKGYKDYDYGVNTLNIPVGLKTYLQSKKYNLMSNNDGTILLDENYNPVTNYEYADYDWTKGDNTTYGYGIFSNDTGKLWVGKIGDLNRDSEFWDLIRGENGYLNRIKNKKSQLWSKTLNPYDIYLNYGSDILDAASLKGVSKKNMYDVSRYFDSNKPIIAYNIDDTELQQTPAGDLIFSPTTSLGWLDDNGEFHVLNWNLLSDEIGKFHIKGWSESPNQAGFDKIISMPRLQLQIADAIENDKNAITRDRKMEAIFGKGFYEGNGSIRDNALKFVDVAFSALEKELNNQRLDVNTEEWKLMYNVGNDPNHERLFLILNDLISNKDVRLTKRQADLYRELYNIYRESHLTQHGDGGVLKAQDGSQLSPLAQALKTASNQSLYEINQSVGGNRKPGVDATPADWVLLGIAAADLASIVAAYFPGAGTLTSAGLGAASTLTQFGVDIAQDGFLASDLKQLGINAVMDIAGLFTGGAGKIGKLVKTAIKLTPFVTSLTYAINNGDEFMKAWSHLTNGKGEPLTVNEWRILAQGLTQMAGMSRVAKGAIIQLRVKNNVHPEGLDIIPKEVAVKVQATEGGKRVTKVINLEQAQEIAKAKDYKEANSLFNHTSTDNEHANLIQLNEPKPWYHFGFGKSKLSETNPLTGNINPTYSTGLINEAAIRSGFSRYTSAGSSSEVNRAFGNTNWFGVGPKVASQRSGGKLDRLQEYLKNK